jgi:hypothetical protein
MKIVEDKEILVSLPATDCVEAAEIVAAHLKGKILEKSQTSSTVRLGSHFAWVMLGVWGANADKRIPINLEISNSDQPGAFLARIVYSPKTPGIYLNVAISFIQRRMDEVAKQLAQLDSIRQIKDVESK